MSDSIEDQLFCYGLPYGIIGIIGWIFAILARFIQIIQPVWDDNATEQRNEEYKNLGLGMKLGYYVGFRNKKMRRINAEAKENKKINNHVRNFGVMLLIITSILGWIGATGLLNNSRKIEDKDCIEDKLFWLSVLNSLTSRRTHANILKTKTIEDMVTSSSVTKAVFENIQSKCSKTFKNGPIYFHGKSFIDKSEHEWTNLFSMGDLGRKTILLRKSIKLTQLVTVCRSNFSRKIMLQVVHVNLIIAAKVLNMQLRYQNRDETELYGGRLTLETIQR
ncbi:hypothetical protein Glove_646g2 [Diversispora epigaea]|uniref:Uncharacterized protein n=1 Tax=Diversispora epigaea TaxID=1348612 RepID=A0A397G7J9_9GLOM|nr:hypothetical protein Glove_646g2 [Diversispora epigaea]